MNYFVNTYVHTSFFNFCRCLVVPDPIMIMFGESMSCMKQAVKFDQPDWSIRLCLVRLVQVSEANVTAFLAKSWVGNRRERA
jgi:hypothetical protein